MILSCTCVNGLCGVQRRLICLNADSTFLVSPENKVTYIRGTSNSTSGANVSAVSKSRLSILIAAVPCVIKAYDSFLEHNKIAVLFIDVL